MASEAWKDEEERPARDQRGRFKRGSSGNPYGRPRKPPAAPWSYQNSLAEALAELVPVTGQDGSAHELTLRDLFLKSMVRGAVKANLRDQVAVFRELTKLNVLVAPDEEQDPDEEGFSEEDRRMLEVIRSEITPMCCGCDKPVLATPAQQARRSDFRFD